MSKYRMTKADAKAFEALCSLPNEYAFEVFPPCEDKYGQQWPWQVIVYKCDDDSDIRSHDGKTFAAAARCALEAAQ